MLTVLVVDDSVDLLSALAEVLGEEGWMVVAAGSTPAAMYAVKEHKIDVVLCDLLLYPGADGLALRDWFRGEGLGHIPFAFMTASPREAARLKGEPFLRKPFVIADVVGFLNDGAIARGERGREDPRPPRNALKSLC